MSIAEVNGTARLWGVCGWFGTVDSSVPSGTVLQTMTEPSWRQDHDRTFVAPDAAVFLSADTPGADLATADGVTAAIFGYPYWSSPTFQALAAANGHGMAALEAYRHHGFDLLSELHGPFGVIVLDRGRARALIAIDRAGIYPMYISSALATGVVFATNANALARHPAMDRTLSPQALFDYLFFYRVPAPGSIFRAQNKLLPAQSLLVEGNRQDLRWYWQMPFTAAGERDAGRLKETLFAQLRTAMGRSVAEEDLARTGAFLSGGLDSSTVVGLLGEMSTAPVKAFTVGFEAEAYDETAFAESVAKTFGADHYIYRVSDEDVSSAAPRIAAAYDEPFGNASAVPVHFCARFAREHGVDLLLAGDGGDELFAGNKVYLQMKIFELYGRIPQALRARVLEPLIQAIDAPTWLMPLRKAQRYIAQAKVPMPDRMFGQELTQFTRATEILADDLAGEVDPLHPLRILREAYQRPPSAALEQRMHHLEQQMVLADNDLRKVNRMCELAGVRVRFPILDEDVMEFSARVPPALFLKGFKLRAFYKGALHGYLPETTIRKRKQGFGLPYGPLLEKGTRLHDLAYESLGALKQRHYLRKDYIDGVMARHRQSAYSVDAAPIWDLMMLELWCQSHP